MQTSLEAARAELEERLRFEAFLTEISARFINLPADRIDDEIERVQRRICEFLDLDRSTLWQVSDTDIGMLALTHVYQLQDYPPVFKGQYAVNLFPWTVQKVLAGEIVMTNISDLPPEASRDRETYTYYETKSTFVCPLSVGSGAVFGVVSFAVTRQERVWPETVVKGIRLIVQMFASALARR